MKTLTSDEEVFNLDKLESKDAKEEYDSDPSDTGSNSGPGQEEGLGSEAKEKKRVKPKRSRRQQGRRHLLLQEKGEGTAKKQTKLPGQPKWLISAYFLWLNSEGRDKIKVYSCIHHIYI